MEEVYFSFKLLLQLTRFVVMPDHPTFVAVLEGLEPESFIGRLVAVFFDPPGSFFEGEAISFGLPHEDDSPDTAADGTLYKEWFSDGDQHDYNITELKNILMHVGKFYDSLPKRKWLWIKLVYSFFFFSDGTIILLPHPGTKVIVDAVTFSLPSFCPASRCATLSSG